VAGGVIALSGFIITGKGGKRRKTKIMNTLKEKPKQASEPLL
jgi:hypothetical protein